MVASRGARSAAATSVSASVRIAARYSSAESWVTIGSLREDRVADRAHQIRVVVDDLVDAR